MGGSLREAMGSQVMKPEDWQSIREGTLADQLDIQIHEVRAWSHRGWSSCSP